MQAGELELVLAKTPAPGEDATPVLMGKQLYFPQQRTDEDLLKLLQPYQNAQVGVLKRPLIPPAQMQIVLFDSDSPNRKRWKLITISAGKECFTSMIAPLYAWVQLLTVGRVTGMMKGFAAKETAEGFWRRMEHIMGLWCCNYDGGIKYSMLPHVTPAEDEGTDEELADE